MIRLMLADDHAMLREGLRSKFDVFSDIKVTGEAGSAKELLEQLKKTPSDVVILDIKLPDANGIFVMQQIKTEHPSCKVIILTMYDHVRYALNALSSGADGFVVKGAPFEELLQAVRDVAANKTFVSSDMASKLLSRVKRDQPKLPLDTLSQREFEVLTLLSSGLSIKEAAAQLNVSEKSIGTYRMRIMEKLDLSNKADLIRFALESGLLE
jgi:DNA-binding NarL/FixJ family response regulator